MKQLDHRARQKIIALVSEVDVDDTTVGEICTDLRSRGFKPPHGKYWTTRKLLEVIEVKQITCHSCLQKVDEWHEVCPECWSNLKR